MGMIGRPQKYAAILWSLPDDELFSPATIAARAREIGLVGPAQDEARLKLLLQRIRISLGRLTHNHDFPRDGDGWVRVWGQGPIAGWCGWRWKTCAHPLDDATYEFLRVALAHLPETERAAILDQVDRL